MYQSIKVEREKVAPITSLTITFDPKNLDDFEEFLKHCKLILVGNNCKYAWDMLANIQSMKGY